jgi:LPXTG-site transpeptidase (sortase) family protein
VGQRLRKNKLGIVGLIMLGVGALLLTASGGYYAYAKLVTTGRDDLIYITERPTLAKVVQPPVEIPVENIPLTHPAFQWEDPAEVAKSWFAEQEATMPEPEPIVIEIQDLVSSGLRGTFDHPAVRIAVDAARADLTAHLDRSTDNASFSDPTSGLARPTDGRIGAAVTTLNIRQARRGLNVPNYSDGASNADLPDPTGTAGLNPFDKFDEGEVVASSRQPVAEKRENPSSDHMVAEYADIGLVRTTNITAQPQYATRITVPGISLSSIVEELEVVEEGDSRSWETPKHVVGHIPTTADPGSNGQGWYFGHLESPIRGEGNVFRELPALAERFKRGEKFQINLDAGDQRFIYEVYRTEVIHQSELAVSNSGMQDITLVACWPQFVYNERILVTAALIDVVEVPESERAQTSSSEL